MEMFRKNLEDFAIKHRDDIRRDPDFRLQFQEMCSSIGVDPLACMHFCVQKNCEAFKYLIFIVVDLSFLFSWFENSSLTALL